MSDCLGPCGLWGPTRFLCPWGFSRQVYWSGLQRPPPGDPPNPGFNPGLPHFRWILYCLSHQRSPRILEWVAMPSSRGSNPNPGIKPMSPALQVDSLLSEPPEKPKNTGVGSLSLLQGIFLTQESNWGLLHSGRFFTN